MNKQRKRCISYAKYRRVLENYPRGWRVVHYAFKVDGHYKQISHFQTPSFIYWSETYKGKRYCFRKHITECLK